MDFQSVLTKEMSQNSVNCAIEYAKFQSNLQHLPLAITKCPEHPQFDLLRCCLDCDVEMCSLCSPEQHHPSHKVKYFTFTTDYNFDHMEENIEKLLKKIKTKKTELDLKNTEIQKKAKKNHEEIIKGFASLHKIIDMQESKVLQNLKLQVEKVENEYQLYLNNYLIHIAQLTSFLSTIEYARQISKKEFYKARDSLLQYGNNLLHLDKKMKLSIHVDLLEIPADQFESIRNKIIILGILPIAKMCGIVNYPKVTIVNKKTTFVVKMKDAEGQTVSNCKDKLIVKLSSTLISKNVPTDVKELGDGHYEVSYTLNFFGDYILRITVCGDNIPGTPCKYEIYTYHIYDQKYDDQKFDNLIIR